MTPNDLRLWQALLRRVGDLSPDLTAALLQAFQNLRDSFSDSEFATLLKTGSAETIVSAIFDQATTDAALAPMQDELRDGIISAVRAFQREVPKTAGGLAIRFDYLNPRVVDAIRGLETRVITSLSDDMRAVAKAVVEKDLTAGLGSKAIAADLRNVIGLGPSQLEQVDNFRDALQGLNGRSIADYTLRDKRFSLPTTPAQLDKQVTAYRNARIAQNANTIARTAALDAMKLSQYMAWQDAIAQGFVDASQVTKRWSGVLDDRERPAHVAMEGETVGINERFSNGQMIPGDTDYNCRCIAVYGRMRAARVREVVPQSVPRALATF